MKKLIAILCALALLIPAGAAAGLFDGAKGDAPKSALKVICVMGCGTPPPPPPPECVPPTCWPL